AEAWGAAAPFLRPAALAADESTSADVARHALAWFHDRGEDFSGLVLVQPTSPLVLPEDVAAVARALAAGASAASVSPAHPPAWTSRVSAGALQPVSDVEERGLV